MTRPEEVFVSHAVADEKFVDRLVSTLRRHDIVAWYSATDLVGGMQWQEEIGAALNRCDSFIVVLSPAALESMWVKRETYYALAQVRLFEKIIPVLYRECSAASLAWPLTNYQYVDFRRGFEAGCRELLRVWDVEYLSES